MPLPTTSPRLLLSRCPFFLLFRTSWCSFQQPIADDESETHVSVSDHRTHGKNYRIPAQRLQRRQPLSKKPYDLHLLPSTLPRQQRLCKCASPTSLPPYLSSHSPPSHPPPRPTRPTLTSWTRYQIYPSYVLAVRSGLVKRGPRKWSGRVSTGVCLGCLAWVISGPVRLLASRD
ncbi:hypothetical protein BJ546DRAFT_1017864, partial [Cryomyces antarcticus]